MKIKAVWPGLILTVAMAGFLVGAPTVHGDDSSSPGRYKILSTPSGQYIQTFMLDKRTGRLWMLRGQVSNAPYLVACVYQKVKSGAALSPLDEEGQSETTEDRFLIKSAPGQQFAETYILDKQNGRLWILRGQVSSGPYLIPIVYQLSSIDAALSPLSTFSPKDRFSLTCVANGSYPETYVNDIESGGMWKMRGQVSDAPFLIPCIYQLVNGETISTPMERQAEVRLLTKPATSLDSQGVYDGASQTPPAPDVKLAPEVQKKLDDGDKKMEEEMKTLFPK